MVMLELLYGLPTPDHTFAPIRDKEPHRQWFIPRGLTMGHEDKTTHVSRTGGPRSARRWRSRRLPGRCVRGALERRHRAGLGDRYIDRRDQRRADRRKRAEPTYDAAARILARPGERGGRRGLGHRAARDPALLLSPPD